MILKLLHKAAGAAEANSRRALETVLGVILVPFYGTIQSRCDQVAVADQYDRSDLIQNWNNGNEFLFLDTKDDSKKRAQIEVHPHVFFK